MRQLAVSLIAKVALSLVILQADFWNVLLADELNSHVTLRTNGEMVYGTFSNPANLRNVFSITEKNRLLNWDVQSADLVWELSLGEGDPSGSAVVVSRDGRWILVGTEGCVWMILAQSGKKVRTFCAPSYKIFASIAISEDNRIIVAGSIGEPVIHKWDAQTSDYLGEMKYKPIALPGPISPPLMEDTFNTALQLDASGSFLVIGSASTVRVLNVNTGGVFITSDMGSFYPNRTITKFAISPDLRLAVATVSTLSDVAGDVGDDGVSVVIKSTETEKLIAKTRLPACGGDVRHLEVSWDSRSVRILCGHGELVDMTVNDGVAKRRTALTHDWQGSSGDINPFLWMARHSFSRDGAYLYTAASDGVRVWKITE